MATNILETLGTVTPDGKLKLDQKVTITPGRVKVRVESVGAPAHPSDTLVEFIERTRREMEAAGSHFMNDEEVTAWIEELRADDDRIERAYSTSSVDHRRL
jgi:hypothetical protein